MLRMKFKVLGNDLQGAPLTFTDPHVYVNQQNISLLVPSFLAGGPCTLEVELCDCEFCEDSPGTGRCVTLRIPVFYQRSPNPAQPTSLDMTRPGSGELHPVGAKP
jgi:hypothetical protein